MITYKTFNTLMDQFFDDLQKIFPTETKISVQQTKFQMLSHTNICKPCEKFMEQMIKHAIPLSQRNEEYFIQLSDDSNSFLNDINLSQNLKSISQDHKDCIWNYLQKLYLMGIELLK